MWPLKIHRWFHASPVLLLVAISGITCGQPTIFPMLTTGKATAMVLFSVVQISRPDPSYPSFQVLWWALGLTSTQRKLHPRFGVWFWMVIAVATRDAHSARYNTSPGVALPTTSRSVNPLRASSGFLCIDTSEICVHQLNPLVEP